MKAKQIKSLGSGLSSSTAVCASLDAQTTIPFELKPRDCDAGLQISCITSKFSGFQIDHDNNKTGHLFQWHELLKTRGDFSNFIANINLFTPELV
jgi:hypothetical protein